MDTERADNSRSSRRRHAPRTFEVKGREWRTTDPGLEEDIRQLVVNALMDGRRWVRDAKRSPDPAEMRAARAHVDLAKNALGERGQPWWEIEADGISETRVRAMAAVLRWETRKSVTEEAARQHLIGET